MAAITREQAEWVAAEVAELPAKEFTAAVRRYAKTFGCSVSTVQRALRKAGVRRRGKSSRAGVCSVPEDDLFKLAHVISRTAKHKDETPLLSVENARDILVRSGVESLGTVTASTLARLLRERGLSARQVRELRARPPRVAVKVSGPNAVHHLDASVCPQFFFGKSGLVYDQDLKSTIYKNKPKRVRAVFTRERLVIRWAVIDAASGAFYVDYVESAGETAADAIDFLIAGWSRKSDPRYEFHGVPRILVGDKGSATLKPGSPCFQFVSNLGCRPITHAPGNPAAKGVVESFMGWWERSFEARLALQPAADVGELRAWAADFAIHLQTTRTHSRHGQTRFDAWRRIAQEDLRELPRDRERITEVVSYAPVSRVVTSRGIVNFGGSEWRVPSSDLHGKRVLVYRDLWKPNSIELVLEERPDGERYVAEPLARDAWGYAEGAAEWGKPKRLPDSRGQTAMKAALKEELPELRALGEWAEAGDEGKVASIPRRGEELEPVASPKVAMLSNSAARDLLRELLDEKGISTLTTEDWFVVDEAWGESVAEKAVAAMADRIVAMRFSGGSAEERTA